MIIIFPLSAPPFLLVQGTRKKSFFSSLFSSFPLFPMAVARRRRGRHSVQHRGSLVTFIPTARSHEVKSLKKIRTAQVHLHFNINFFNFAKNTMMPLKTLFLFPLRSLSIPLGATDLGGESPFFILIPSFLLPLSLLRICRGRGRYRSLPPPPPLPTHLLI